MFMDQEAKKGRVEPIDLKALKRTALLRYFLLFPILGLSFFLPAWSLKYWEGWLYIFVIAIPVAIFGLYLFKNDPGLLERRMRTKETRKEQKLILKISGLSFPLIFLLPGLDKRLGWSNVPVFVELASFALVLLGYFMVTAVFRANRYASRVVEVEEGQKVISTGPYGVVRHPMYSSLIVLYLFTPLALGSYWAVIPAGLFLLVLVPRIIGEEKELGEKLEGYREYCAKVRFRLIPGIW
jgi:protein-S-isoprenylcysteine O-methyltransferase Ste14